MFFSVECLPGMILVNYQYHMLHFRILNIFREVNWKSPGVVVIPPRLLMETTCKNVVIKRGSGTF